ncbi:MAG: DUF1947 domain-containing protein [Candidatus Hodarchaeaceae archaeon]|nr:DUF1947 domain-containing protein [Candidatus Hodarchaeaceae archaeon]
MSINRRYHPRGALIKQLTAELANRFGKAAIELLKGDIEIVELKDGIEVVLVNGKPFVIKTKDGFFPTLASVDRIPLKRVVIDMGAVPHIVSGADIMAPGVVAADGDIALGDSVVVVDERHGKPLAVGLALVAGCDMKAPKGRVVKNLYYVGDGVWSLGSQIKAIKKRLNTEKAIDRLQRGE